MSFKDEGDFYTTKFFQGKPIDNMTLYPFGTLAQESRSTIEECNELAKEHGCTAKFD